MHSFALLAISYAFIFPLCFFWKLFIPFWFLLQNYWYARCIEKEKQFYYLPQSWYFSVGSIVRYGQLINNYTIIQSQAELYHVAREVDTECLMRLHFEINVCISLEMQLQNGNTRLFWIEAKKFDQIIFAFVHSLDWQLCVSSYSFRG